MSKMKNLKDLFEHELQDLYSAEGQIIEALQKMEKKANDNALQKAFSQHLKETEKQKERLEEVCDNLGISPEGEKCKAMAGLVAEGEAFMKEDADPEVMDAGLIAIAQKVEHYEIASYGTVCHYADRLGESEALTLLKKTLSEEKDTDQKLNDLAKQRINERAEVH